MCNQIEDAIAATRYAEALTALLQKYPTHTPTEETE